jgi:hypothetical protein
VLAYLRSHRRAHTCMCVCVWVGLSADCRRAGCCTDATNTHNRSGPRCWTQRSATPKKKSSWHQRGPRKLRQRRSAWQRRRRRAPRLRSRQAEPRRFVLSSPPLPLCALPGVTRQGAPATGRTCVAAASAARILAAAIFPRSRVPRLPLLLALVPAAARAGNRLIFFARASSCVAPSCAAFFRAALASTSGRPSTGADEDEWHGSARRSIMGERASELAQLGTADRQHERQTARETESLRDGHERMLGASRTRHHPGVPWHTHAHRS